MVFGFLKKGDMKLTLNKLSFNTGEKVIRDVSMILKKPINARGVNARLVAEQKTTQRTNDGTRTNTVNLIDVAIPLDGEKEYGTQPHDYHFEIAVPPISQAKAPDGGVGTVLQAASFLAGRSTVVNWYVDVKLDVPKGFDLGKKQAITVV